MRTELDLQRCVFLDTRASTMAPSTPEGCCRYVITTNVGEQFVIVIGTVMMWGWLAVSLAITTQVLLLLSSLCTENSLCLTQVLLSFVNFTFLLPVPIPFTSSYFGRWSNVDFGWYRCNGQEPDLDHCPKSYYYYWWYRSYCSERNTAGIACIRPQGMQMHGRIVLLCKHHCYCTSACFIHSQPMVAILENFVFKTAGPSMKGAWSTVTMGHGLHSAAFSTTLQL